MILKRTVSFIIIENAKKKPVRDCLSVRFYSDKNRLKSYDDYKYYLSTKALLREPAITRLVTAQAFKYGKNLMSLAEGMPNENMFPFSEISIKLTDGEKVVLEGDKLMEALQYIPSQGLPRLIESLKTFQEKVHGISMADRDLIVCNGSQEGIYKSIEMLLEPGDPILVQSPTYTGMYTVMRPYQPEIIEVPEDNDGMIPDILEQLLYDRVNKGLKMPKALYLIPSGSNPSGTVLPDDRRKKIYEIACRFDFIILEDDPYHFMSFKSKTPTSFMNYDVEGRVLRFDSFSKVLSSGMRLGWVTGPKALIDILELHTQASSLHSATLTQVILIEMLNMWGLDRLIEHFNMVRDFYWRRRDLLQLALEKHLTGLAEWTVPQAGMFFWLKVKGVDDVYDMVVYKAFERSLVMIPGHAFASDTKAPTPYIRLAFSKIDEQDIDVAIQKLAELIREEQAKTCSAKLVNS